MTPITLKNTNKFSFLHHHRELLIAFCAVLVIFVAFIFPAKVIGEQFWLNIFLFLVFPATIVRFLLKEPLSNFGLSWGDPKKGIALSAAFLIIFVFLNYLIIRVPSLRSQLAVTPELAKSFLNFLWLELVVILFLHFSWEFFFRGFLQFGLEKKWGGFALFIQAIAQTILMVKGSWLMIAMIFLSSLAAGFIAQKSRSVVYSFAAMWLISVSLDIMLIRMIHLGAI